MSNCLLVELEKYASSNIGGQTLRFDKSEFDGDFTKWIRVENGRVLAGAQYLYRPELLTEIGFSAEDAEESARIRSRRWEFDVNDPNQYASLLARHFVRTFLDKNFPF